MLQEYYYHGKLLLTGEYFVLDGATALAIPTKAGQRFTVTPFPSPTRYELTWSVGGVSTSRPIRSHSFHAGEWNEPRPGGEPVRDRLLQLFHAAEQLKPGCTEEGLVGKHVHCYLEFEPSWGLGSSSTLVSFLAEFLGVDPYALLAGTFGGSGYDLACATAAGPILYKRGESGRPLVSPITWRPDWLRQTYFVYRNRKQDSRQGIRAYRAADVAPQVAGEVSELTGLLQVALHLRTAARLLERHERLIAEALALHPVQETFPDFPGTLKSLGAWGGDFIWALSEQPREQLRAYFAERGYGTFIPYHDMAL
ncbi:GYDIA family GHMP kinase [Neolewinella sp.]|uniref:GYDIA family GHMP kinase n=1 Tax=Neolewinella sp. TaxID=2993543 RepID=UPI003B526BDE